MKWGVLWLFGAALTIAVAGCGSSSAVSPESAKPVANSHVDSAPSTSPVAATLPSTVDGNSVLSVLSVEHQVDVSTDRDGLVVSIVHDQGTTVTQGEVLAKLDDRTLQVELVKARDDLQVAQNNVKYKEAELKAKTAGFKRQQQLHDLGLSSQADLDNADFEAKGAEYDMHGYEALVESSNAEIHRLEIEIEKTSLRAPFSGVVVGRYVREGQEITKGDKCFRVSQLAPLQVQFQIPESSGHRPTHGSDVKLTLVSDPARPLNARIVKISPVIDPASDSYNVTAQLDGKNISDLRPGMAVRVALPATTRSSQ
jgi:RND family efflux transporter MFP subunit